MIRKIIVILAYCFAVIALTILTQVGGIAYLLAMGLGHFWKRSFKGKGALLFLGMYGLFTFLLTPMIASFWGREKVRHSNIVKPTTYMTVILNRNYVRPSVNEVLEEAALSLGRQGIEIRYLDANFPFFDGFPLLPHLSHDDGRKIDISLVYQDQKGNLSNQKKSISGYGVFVLPLASETNQPDICTAKGYRQYNITRYTTFGKVNKRLIFSKKGTKILINSILQSKKVKKIFLEPHLKSRLGIRDGRVRYHGCHAVRHDDHIHVEVR